MVACLHLWLTVAHSQKVPACFLCDQNIIRVFALCLQITDDLIKSVSKHISSMQFIFQVFASLPCMQQLIPHTSAEILLLVLKCRLPYSTLKWLIFSTICNYFYLLNQFVVIASEKKNSGLKQLTNPILHFLTPSLHR